MRITEALQAISHIGEEPRWQSEQTLEKLVLLQDQTVNLLPVLQRNMPNHAHYRPQWFPDQPQEPESLRSAVLSLHGQRNEMGQLYEAYFKQHGIKEIDVTVNPLLEVKAYRRFERDKMWSAKDAITLFPWIDFTIEFEMSDATRIQARRKNSIPILPYFTMNTIRVDGNIYKIDIPIQGNDRRDKDTLSQYIRRIITTRGIQWYDLPDKEWNIDAFVLARKSQRLVTDLLAARV